MYVCMYVDHAHDLDLVVCSPSVYHALDLDFAGAAPVSITPMTLTVLVQPQCRSRT
jgi:hypothetical protein